MKTPPKRIQAEKAAMGLAEAIRFLALECTEEIAVGAIDYVSCQETGKVEGAILEAAKRIVVDMNQGRMG